MPQKQGDPTHLQQPQPPNQRRAERFIIQQHESSQIPPQGDMAMLIRESTQNEAPSQRPRPDGITWLNEEILNIKSFNGCRMLL